VSINKSNYFHLVRAEQAINLRAFPLGNKSFILVFIVLIHVYKSSRKFIEYSNIMHTKIHFGRQGLALKASQTFFDNTSVQQNIVENISNNFLDFQ